jgi:hypothetical protein
MKPICRKATKTLLSVLAIEQGSAGLLASPPVKPLRPARIPSPARSPTRPYEVYP